MTTVIYKVFDDEDESQCYVGSTTNFLQREWQHKSAIRCNNGIGCPLVVDYFYVIPYRFRMEILETLDTDDLKVKYERERHWYDVLNPPLNNSRPNAVLECESRADYKLKWQQEHKEAHNKRCAEYYARKSQETTVCDKCDKTLKVTSMSRHIQKCRGKIEFNPKIHHECEYCGKIGSRQHKSTHLKTCAKNPKKVPHTQKAQA